MGREDTSWLVYSTVVQGNSSGNGQSGSTCNSRRYPQLNNARLALSFAHIDCFALYHSEHQGRKLSIRPCGKYYADVLVRTQVHTYLSCIQKGACDWVINQCVRNSIYSRSRLTFLADKPTLTTASLIVSDNTNHHRWPTLTTSTTVTDWTVPDNINQP
jgi:hypothetical protein